LDQVIPGTSITTSVTARSNLNTTSMNFYRLSTNGDMMVDRLISQVYDLSLTSSNQNTGNRIEFEVGGEV